MAFHYITQGYFGDQGYQLLTRDEGYFFDFLWQLPQLSAAGIGELSLPMMATQSYGKFTILECRDLLVGLQRRHRVVYDMEWLWVVNYFKYKPGGAKSVLINARESLRECESKLIFDGWWKKYGQRALVKKVFGKMVFGWGADRHSPDTAAKFLAGIKAEPAEIHLHRAEVEAVWIHYQKVMGMEGYITPTRRQKILERLRENIVELGIPRVVSVEDIFRAISNCQKSDWHMGRHQKHRGHKYNRLERDILGTQEKFLAWLSYDGSQPVTAGTPARRVVAAALEEVMGPRAKWAGARTPPDESKAIIKQTLKKLKGPEDTGSTEQVFRG